LQPELNKYTKNAMQKKRSRLDVIKELLRANVVRSQEELIKLLKERDLEVTQATLSRDLKTLKVAKTPLTNGTYKYVLPHNGHRENVEITNKAAAENIIPHKISFSGQLAVLKTNPGYASAIAWEIDNYASNDILGTIAGDDTVLIVLGQETTKNQALLTLEKILPIK
jgi:transcriptional regulator of arginine metabolism